MILYLNYFLRKSKLKNTCNIQDVKSMQKIKNTCNIQDIKSMQKIKNTCNIQDVKTVARIIAQISQNIIFYRKLFFVKFVRLFLPNKLRCISISC